MVRAIEWLDVPRPTIRLIDQTLLPDTERYVDVTTVDVLVEAIGDLVVRGAPALGSTGALGVALAMVQAADESWDPGRLEAEIDRIRDARPTAVNLAWGVNQVRGSMPSEPGRSSGLPCRSWPRTRPPTASSPGVAPTGCLPTWRSQKCVSSRTATRR